MPNANAARGLSAATAAARPAAVSARRETAMGTAARLSSDAEARAATRRTPPALAALEVVGAARTREDAEVAANIANAWVACRGVAPGGDVASTMSWTAECHAAANGSWMIHSPRHYRHGAGWTKKKRVGAYNRETTDASSSSLKSFTASSGRAPSPR